MSDFRFCDECGTKHLRISPPFKSGCPLRPMSRKPEAFKWIQPFLGEGHGTLERVPYTDLVKVPLEQPGFTKDPLEEVDGLAGLNPTLVVFDECSDIPPAVFAKLGASQKETQ